MKATNILNLLVLICLLGCSEGSDRSVSIVNHNDYQSILEQFPIEKSNRLENQDASIKFWETKLKHQSNGYLYMQKLAGLYQQKFSLTGDIKLLNKAKDLLLTADEIIPIANVTLKHQLATNSLSSHDFQSALSYQFEAVEIGEKQYLSKLLLFDGLMETGEYKSAAKILDGLKEKDTFGYLIRASKMNDHLGDLDGAIFNMQQALKKVDRNKGELYLWTMSNLGDMYGHAGKIKEAYNCYLKVLNIAPYYDYAWKGIAWIAFSHDKNVEEAKKLLSIIKKNRISSPEIDLLLSEIAAFEGNINVKNSLLENFIAEVSKASYGKMYNKHIALITSEETADYKHAIQLCGQEIINRPTPQSYDVLAWSYFQMGAIDKAYAIGKTYVDGATFEPEAAYHLGMIYLANGNSAEGHKLLNDAKSSSFELGPNVLKEINAIYH